ncbi:MAG: hypothetical protein HHJ17_11615 [Rhodoferax sp.]|uniref:poly-gamma-glutamate hydrolase family protein n=1 Tax=Rhodoferax sp. TaxID=50421 RepID=UPI0017AC30B0|nr:hypothetical protein [Rhodoferax sp.]
MAAALSRTRRIAIALAISALDIDTQVEGNRFPATDPMNICNRGRRGVGVQIEMTMPLRLQGPIDALASAIRSVLVGIAKSFNLDGLSRWARPTSNPGSMRSTAGVHWIA